MKSFFKLIGVAIHWTCFLFGSFGAFSVFFNTLLEGPNADGIYYFYLIFGPVLGILISLFGTLMRFILARETKYLPWSKVKKIENNSNETDAPIEIRRKSDETDEPIEIRHKIIFTGSKLGDRLLTIWVVVVVFLVIFSDLFNELFGL